MINRGLVRRLEELESRLAPMREPLRIRVSYVDVEGNVVSSHVVEGPTFRAPPAGQTFETMAKVSRRCGDDSDKAR